MVVILVHQIGWLALMSAGVLVFRSVILVLLTILPQRNFCLLCLLKHCQLALNNQVDLAT
jgi:hypothetical protein